MPAAQPHNSQNTTRQPCTARTIPLCMFIPPYPCTLIPPHPCTLIPPYPYVRSYHHTHVLSYHHTHVCSYHHTHTHPCMLKPYNSQRCPTILWKNTTRLPTDQPYLATIYLVQITPPYHTRITYSVQITLSHHTLQELITVLLLLYTVFYIFCQKTTPLCYSFTLARSCKHYPLVSAVE